MQWKSRTGNRSEEDNLEAFARESKQEVWRSECVTVYFLESCYQVNELPLEDVNRQAGMPGRSRSSWRCRKLLKASSSPTPTAALFWKETLTGSWNHQDFETCLHHFFSLSLSFLCQKQSVAQTHRLSQICWELGSLGRVGMADWGILPNKTEVQNLPIPCWSMWRGLSRSPPGPLIN